MWSKTLTFNDLVQEVLNYAIDNAFLTYSSGEQSRVLIALLFKFQVDEMQTVQTTYGETNVRNGICADETQSIPFAFWRKLASVNIADGDCIKIINAVVSKTTDGQPKLSGNQRTAIEVVL